MAPTSTASVVERKFNKPKFVEADHPRDRRGRFIEVGGIVSLWGGGQGTVERAVGGGRIEVLRNDGKRVVVDSGNTTIIAKPDGTPVGNVPIQARPDVPDAPKVPATPERPDTPTPDAATLDALVGNPDPQASTFDQRSAAQDAVRNAASARIAAATADVPLDKVLTAQQRERLADDSWVWRRNSDGVGVRATDRAFAVENGVDFMESDDPEVEKALREGAVNDLINTWKASSSNPESLAITTLVAQAFGLPEPQYHGAFGRYSDPEAEKAKVADIIAERGPFLAAAAQAMYEDTQAEFARAGITHVTVSRGMIFKNEDGVPDWVKPGQGPVDLNAVSSFTYDPAVAARFAYRGAPGSTSADGMTGVVIDAEVPVAHVFSMASGGLGSLVERETLVIGHPDTTWRVSVDGNDGGAAVPRAGSAAADAPQSPEPDAPAPAEADAAPEAPAAPVVPRIDPIETAGVIEAKPATPATPVPVQVAERADLPEALDSLLHDGLPEGLGKYEIPKAAKAEVVDTLTAALADVPIEKMHPYPATAKAVTDPGSRWVRNERMGTWDPVGSGTDLGEPLSDEIRDDLRRHAVNSMVAAWAETSADHSPDSLAMQQVAERLFDIPPSNLNRHASDATFQDEIDQVLARRGEGMEAFLRAQYAETQRRLSEAGINEVTLYRGMQFSRPGEGPDYTADRYSDTPPEVPGWAGKPDSGVPSRALNSWTADPAVAQDFANHRDGVGVVAAATVPRERILSFPRSGVGCLDESEFVVIGDVHASLTAFDVKYDPAAADYVRSPHVSEDLPVPEYRGTPIFGARPAPTAVPADDVEIHVPRGGQDDEAAIAWLDADPETGTETGYLRTRADDPDSTLVFTDIEDWTSYVDEFGLVRESEAGEPLPSPPERRRIQAVTTPGIDRYYQDDVERLLGSGFTSPEDEPVEPDPDSYDDELDYEEAMDEYALAYDAWQHDQERKFSDLSGSQVEEYAKVAKASVVADLSRRMAGVKDADLLDETVMSRIERMRSGEVVLWAKRYSGYGDDMLADHAFVEAKPGALPNIEPNRMGQDHPPFEVDVDQYVAAQREAAVNKMVATWAQTSNDSHKVSLAMQEIAAEMFDIPSERVTDWSMGSALSEEVEEEKATRGAAYRAFLTAMYDATQERFAKAGITHVSLYRGHKIDSNDDPDWVIQGWREGYTGPVDQRPLSSWSIDRDIAESFANGSINGGGADDVGVVMTATIPVERIIATPRSGIGCLNEQEFVVLAGEGDVEVSGTGTLYDEYDREYDPWEGPDPDPEDEEDEDAEPDDPDDQWRNSPTSIMDAEDLPKAFAVALADLDSGEQYGYDPRVRLGALTARATDLGREDLIPESWANREQYPVGSKKPVSLMGVGEAMNAGAKGTALVTEWGKNDDGSYRIVVTFQDGTTKEFAQAGPEMNAQIAERPDWADQYLSPAPEASAPEATAGQDVPVLDTVNPSDSGVFEDYESGRAYRASAPLGPNMGTLAETSGVDPDTEITVYRGVPTGTQTEIQPGDFVTTNPQLAADYAGTGEVIEMRVRAGDILDGRDAPGEEEYLYRPGAEVSPPEPSAGADTPGIDAPDKAAGDSVAVQDLSPGDRIVLANGQVGEIVSVEPGPSGMMRMTVRTPDGETFTGTVHPEFEQTLA